MAKPPEDDSFLSRWSRRKAEARIEEEVPPPDDPAAKVLVPEPAPAPITDEELAALPKIDDLVAGMDIRGFLRPGVPSTLKNAALQKMWLLTPAIRDYRDPAVDYAWDWNTPGGVPGDGVAPSPERAAQMMRDLFAPRPPKEDKAPVTETPLAEGPDEGESLQNAAESDQTSAQDPSEPEPDKNPSNQSDTDGAIPRRRHGGAFPT